MVRIAIEVMPETPYHMQMGNNRMDVLFNEKDRLV